MRCPAIFSARSEKNPSACANAFSTEENRKSNRSPSRTSSSTSSSASPILLRAQSC